MKTGPSHGGESWGRHSMRPWGDGRLHQLVQLLPVPQRIRLLWDIGSSFGGGVLPRRDCAVSFAVILPMGIAVEHPNSAPLSRRGFFVPRRNAGTFGKFRI